MGIRSWIVAIALASVSVQVFAASFPCYNAATYAEVAVCADPELSRQDEELAVLYQKALARLSDPKSVQWVQKNWLEGDRDQCRTVLCVKDSYSKRIAGLRRQLDEPAPHSSERSQSTIMRSPRAQVAAAPASASPSDGECGNLNAAVKAALNSKIPAASLTQFGGRLVTGWRQSDYDAFLIALTACSSRETVAPEISVFTDEARTLLTTLRQRAVRIGAAEPSTAPPTEANTVSTNAVAESRTQEVEDWQFRHNPNGAVMFSSSRAATIYIGKSCDATSPQYGNGAWEYSNAGWRVRIGDKTFAFPRMVPPVLDEQGSPPTQCELAMDTSPAPAVAAAPVAQPVPVAPPPVQQQPAPRAPAPVVRSALTAPAATTTAPVQASAPAATTTAPSSQPAGAIGNILVVLLVVWLAIVLIGIVAGFKGAIVVYRNFDDLAIVFFMGVIVVFGGLTGFYLAGFKDSFATPLVWGLSILGTMILLGWTIARTWRDQQPASVWCFALALITKMSLGILFVNNLVTLISPSGKTFGSRSRARGSALLFLAVLTPIVMRLVRDHDGVWAPHNLLSSFNRRRMGI